MSSTHRRVTSTNAWYSCVAAAVLALGILLAYQGIDQNSFHFDDWPNILDNPSARMSHISVDALVDAARNASLRLRPVPAVTFAIDWWRGGGTASTFLITNLVLHILASWAVLLLLQQTLRARIPPNSDRLVTLAAAGGALWWALQPIHVQAVSYIVQRMTLIAALFSVISVLAYLRARSPDHRTAPWLAISICSFGLAALSKENAWITPLLLLQAEFLVARIEQPLLRSRADWLLLALPAIAAIAALTDLAVAGPLSRWALRGYETRSFTLIERLLTQPSVVLFHVSQILWPSPDRFSLEHDVEIVTSVASLRFWLPAAIIAAWTLTALWLASQPRRRIIAFWMLWIPVTLVIESSFVPLELVFEHRMYLPTVGFAGLIAVGLSHLPPLPHARAVIAWIAVAAASLFSLWSTHHRIPQWQTETALYRQAVKVAPHSARAWNQLGISLLNQRRSESVSAEHYEQAMEAFSHAIELDAKYAAPWTNRGVARWMHGDTSIALVDLETAVTLSEKEAAAFHYLFEIYQAAGRGDDARRVRHRACFLGVRSDCYR